VLAEGDIEDDGEHRDTERPADLLLAEDQCPAEEKGSKGRVVI
jgi:hypothetical protein